MKSEIIVEALVKAPIEKVWQCWTEPEHTTKWCFASDDWCAPKAANDLRVGGVFTTRMEAKDGSAGFDFGGTYTEVVVNERIAYTMNGEDERKVSIVFAQEGDSCRVTETFEAENENSLELQKNGWQSILENFKQYTETL
jgi:uncharacterized protein YndB with AHSA1/START domain